MTQEEKSLLLQDLCARLPYGVMGSAIWNNKIWGLPELLLNVNVEEEKVECSDSLPYSLENFRPYLRPMSSMTQEEIDEYDKELSKDMDIIENGVIDKEKLIASNGNCSSMNFIPHYGNDWLNKKMFDYRGLIGKNLALEASKDMYNN